MVKGWMASVGAGTALLTVKRVSIGNTVDPVEGVDDDSHWYGASIMQLSVGLQRAWGNSYPLAAANQLEESSGPSLKSLHPIGGQQLLCLFGTLEFIQCLWHYLQSKRSMLMPAIFSPFFGRYVGVDHALEWIVISVRGTLHGNDILTDVCAEVLPFDSGNEIFSHFCSTRPQSLTYH